MTSTLDGSTGISTPAIPAAGAIGGTTPGVGNFTQLVLTGALQNSGGHHIGNFTRVCDAATGDVSYTGVGFKPSLILFMGSVDATFTVFFGWDNGTSYACTTVNTSNSWYTGPSGSLYLHISGGSDFQRGYVLSMDTDEFTIHWTKSGTPAAVTGNVMYLALR
jgi:hypothetical protein